MKKPLEVIGLSKTYNTKEAVKDVSFKVNQNEIIGIVLMVVEKLLQSE